MLIEAICIREDDPILQALKDMKLPELQIRMCVNNHNHTASHDVNFCNICGAKINKYEVRAKTFYELVKL